MDRWFNSALTNVAVLLFDEWPISIDDKNKL